MFVSFTVWIKSSSASAEVTELNIAAYRHIDILPYLPLSLSDYQSHQSGFKYKPELINKKKKA